MAFCKHRVMDKCKKDGRPCIFSKDCFEPEEEKVQTNADRIRAMSDEELAIMFAMLRADLNRLDAAVRPYSGKDVNDNYDWLQKSVE